MYQTVVLTVLIKLNTEILNARISICVEHRKNTKNNTLCIT